MAFRGAFDCVRCPQTSNPLAKRACPAWWETIWTNPAGETKVDRGCGWIQLPTLLNAMAQSVNGAAVSAQQMRDASIEVMKLQAVRLLRETPDIVPDPEIRWPGPIDPAAGAIDHRYVPEDSGGGEQSRIRHNSPTAGDGSGVCSSDGPNLLRHNSRKADLV